MWRTPEGDRVLTRGEAALFRASLDSLIFHLDMLDDPDDPMTVGVSVFDRLSLPEKLAVIEQVGRALLRKSVRCPAHTAVAEGAIAAVYYHALGDIEVEIDEGRKDVRRLVQAACREAGQAERLPRISSDDLEAWAQAIEGLMELVLWDSDWDSAVLTPDMHPDAARALRSLMRINDDYYIAVPPDPSPAQLRRVRANLRQLVRKVGLMSGRGLGGRAGQAGGVQAQASPRGIRTG